MRNIVVILSTALLAFLALTYQGISKLDSQENYSKLSSKEHPSMIIGTSKAAKLSAELMANGLSSTSVNTELYNFAFNLGMSPFGEAYNEQIQQHLSHSNERNGLFIICIDPWALSAPIGQSKENGFPEENTSINFNEKAKYSRIEYFFDNFPGSFYSVLLPEKEPQLEESLPDEDFIQKHREAKIRSYKREHFTKEAVSNLRINALFELIDILNDVGTVYLVRLPVDEKMVELEQEYCQEFDAILYQEVKEHKLDLIDFYPYAKQFICPDGNHLWQKDAEKVSKIIGDVIQLRLQGELKSDDDLLRSYIQNPKAKYSLSQ